MQESIVDFLFYNGEYKGSDKMRGLIGLAFLNEITVKLLTFT